jgi:hypothetical protein
MRCFRVLCAKNIFLEAAAHSDPRFGGQLLTFHARQHFDHESRWAGDMLNLLQSSMRDGVSSKAYPGHKARWLHSCPRVHADKVCFFLAAGVLHTEAENKPAEPDQERPA